MTASTIAPAAGPPATKSQLLRSYDPADFPALTGREELWRFTPLPRLRGLLDAAGPAAGTPPRARYGELPAGLTVSTVDTSDARRGTVLTPFDRISALAYAGATEVLAIEVAAGAQVPATTVELTGTGGSAPGYGHTLVQVGELAEAVLVLRQNGGGTLADNVEVSLGPAARLTLVTVTDRDAAAVQAQHIRFRVGRDAHLTHVQVSLGGDLLRQFVSVEYAGRGGQAELYGLYLAGAAQHIEHRLLVDHALPDCRSYVSYRGALQGAGARTVWVGDVLIRAAATGTDTYEVNRNLVLSDGARADSVPNLEIETGEVVGAGHASTTGRFDDEQLFYLMSRGIPADQARRLVVRGFFAELLGRVPDSALREELTERIEARLGEDL